MKTLTGRPLARGAAAGASAGGPDWQMSEPLAIPGTFPTQRYRIAVEATGFTGWDVELSCSQADADGNPISLPRTPIVRNEESLGVSALLAGGFQAQLTVNLYSPDGEPPPAGATVVLSCDYVAQPPETRQADGACGPEPTFIQTRETSMQTATRPAAVRRTAASASTGDGFYFRDNPASEGQVPAAPPYNLCPDIIRSGTPIPDAGTALSSPASWQTFYDCAPTAGNPNYYYLRGMNGAPAAGSQAAPATDALSLYWAPAQLILFPQTWKNNPLTTAAGAETVPVSAAPGHVGVGQAPFVWTPPPLPAGSTFYSFVSQAAGAAPTAPLPGDWMGMSQLLTQQPGLGFRNAVYVDPAASAWTHQVGITIPATVGAPGQLMLTVTASGFAGCTLGLVADRFTAEQSLVVLEPVKLSDSFLTGFQFTADPGYAAHLTVQCWNPGGAVAPGSTITMMVSYVVPSEEIEEAMRRGVLDSGFARQVAAAAGVGPQAVAPLGAVSFVAGTVSTPEPGS